ncbi:MAG: SRPBCC family protein [Cyanobacteria bacterium P01_A01_bin.105]
MVGRWVQRIWQQFWRVIERVPLLSGGQRVKRPLERTYEVLSTASVEVLWQTVIDLANVSAWHPMITATNAPHGLMAKPGLIYRAFTRWAPLPVQVFVEKVLPGELLSARLLPVPGLEEQVVYRIESTVWGTRVSYTVRLRGWLSPLAWSVLQPYASQVAIALVQAAEQPQTRRPVPDIFGMILLGGWMVGISGASGMVGA